MYSFAVEVPRVYEESLGRGRQSVAHGVVAAITDARAVDDSEVRVRIGRRQQAAGTAVPALGRERAEEGASRGGGDGVDEEGAVLACSLDFYFFERHFINLAHTHLITS